MSETNSPVRKKTSLRAGLLGAGLLGAVAGGGVALFAERTASSRLGHPIEEQRQGAAIAGRTVSPQAASFYGLVLGKHSDALMVGNIDFVARQCGLHPSNVIESIRVFGGASDAGIDEEAARNEASNPRYSGVLKASKGLGITRFVNTLPKKVHAINQRWQGPKYERGRSYPREWLPQGEARKRVRENTCGLRQVSGKRTSSLSRA